jgi:hypothetical protein
MLQEVINTKKRELFGIILLFRSASVLLLLTRVLRVYQPSIWGACPSIRYKEKEPCDPVTQKSPCNNIGGIMKA